MSIGAIVMMVVAMVIVWGGLTLAIVLLLRNDRAVSRADARSDVRPGDHLTRDL